MVRKRLESTIKATASFSDYTLVLGTVILAPLFLSRWAGDDPREDDPPSQPVGLDESFKLWA